MAFDCSGSLPRRFCDPSDEGQTGVRLRQPQRRVRVLFFFPDDASEVRFMREPPAPGRLVRSPEGAAWRVADVFHTGLETYTVMCEKPPLIAKVPELAADHLRQADALAADLLHRAKDSIARQEIRRRWRERNYFP